MQKCKSCERALDKFGRLFPRPNVNKIQYYDFFCYFKF